MKRYYIFIIMFIILFSEMVNAKNNVLLINNKENFYSLTIPEYHYQNKIVVSNPNDFLLENYQVNISLGSSWVGWNYVKPDGSDIIITDSHGNLLPYWIEEWDYSNKKAIIWVKIPSIPSKSFTRIFIHYGNPSFTSHSNGDQVFEFFDDFNGNSLDTTKWVTNANIYKVESGYIKMWGEWNENKYYINSIKEFNSPVRVIGKFKVGQTGTDTDLFIGFRTSQDGVFVLNGYDTIFDTQGGSDDYHQKGISYENYTYLKGCGTITDTKWHYFRVTFKSNEIRFWDDLLGECSVTGYGLNKFYLSIGADTDDSNRFGYFDWIAVIKYVDNEPLVRLDNHIIISGITIIV